MKHKTVTLISSALLDIEDFRLTFGFKHTYIVISLFRSSLSHIYYSLLYSIWAPPLPYFPCGHVLWRAFLALSNEFSCSQAPRMGATCLRPAWLCWVNLTKSVRGMRKETHTDTQTYNRKLGKGGLHVPDGKRERLPEPECLFYRSVQGKDSGKHQALTILWFKVKRMRFGGLIFLRLMKLNYNTSVLESSRYTGHLI
jgi:hypothetical protein